PKCYLPVKHSSLSMRAYSDNGFSVTRLNCEDIGTIPSICQVLFLDRDGNQGFPYTITFVVNHGPQFLQAMSFAQSLPFCRIADFIVADYHVSHLKEAPFGVPCLVGVTGHLMDEWNPPCPITSRPAKSKPNESQCQEGYDHGRNITLHCRPLGQEFANE